jgi:nifR3 family TIM-barrel protein
MQLPKPFYALAPMLDVTDAAFRRIIAKYGKPDVMCTEFVSADGLCSRGREKLLPMLAFTPSERPIVAQIFSASPEKIREAAALIRELGFDGVDINMGCPDRNVVKQGAGAALIKSPKLAREIIRAAKEGVQGKIPVSVKTRTGDSRDSLEEWLPELLSEEPAAVTIHARTRKDLSKVPARWALVREAVEIRNKLGSKTLIIGNGDVKSVEEARERADATGCDGVMLGRAIFGNPWLFSGLVRAQRDSQTESPATGRVARIPSREEKLRVLVEHTKLFEELYASLSVSGSQFRVKNFDVMKKHFKAYVTGWDGASELRMKLMEAKTAGKVGEVVEGFLKG